MTSVLSWYIYVSLCPGSFCTPRPNLPWNTKSFQVSLDFLLLHSNPLWWKGHLFFLVLVLEGIVGLHRTGQLQLLQHQWLGHRLGLLWCWNGFALEMNRNHSVVFELAPKYSISDSLVDYEGYSISSKGFLPTVVDTVVIWIKFTHSCPF